MNRRVQVRFDPVALLEAAYRMDVDDESWLHGLAWLWGDRFRSDFPTQAILCDVTPGPAPRKEDVAGWIRASNRPLDDPLVQGAIDCVKCGDLTQFGAAMQQAAILGIFSVSEHSRQFPDWSGAVPWAAKKHGFEAADYLGACIATPRSAVGIGALQKRDVAPTSRERRSYRALLEHLSAALRLRESFGWAGAEGKTAPKLEAVFAPDGQVFDASGAAESREARTSLRQAVIAMDRARRSLSRDNNDHALSVWKGLIRGRWSLLERFDADGRRFIVAYENRCRLPSPRALTSGETRALKLLGEGHNNTAIAEILSLSQSTVSQRLAAAAAKLGSGSLTELGAWATQFARSGVDGYPLSAEDEPQHVAQKPSASSEGPSEPEQQRLELAVVSTAVRGTLPGLSGAEQATVELVLVGLSRQQIAQTRGVALATINNQLASAYRKLGVSNSRELARVCG